MQSWRTTDYRAELAMYHKNKKDYKDKKDKTLMVIFGP
jgi:hypothetical protein